MASTFNKAGHGACLAAVVALVSLGCVSGEAARTRTGTGGSGATGGQTGTGGGGSGGATGTGGAGIVTGGTGGTVGQVALPLPLIVTSVYNNQGWFGDGAVMAFFASGSMVIRQADSTVGPCASRLPMALGRCLEVVYTPPTGLVQPDGGAGTYVGVFMLTTLMMGHPELTPPAVVGDANWGTEPGKLIAPGATKISFRAAAATAGLSVAFRAGIATDPFTLPEQLETLTTDWGSYELSLAGITYQTPILGGFAWVLHDTSRPATFYLDRIAWE